MKFFKILFTVAFSLNFLSCEIVQEVNFNEDQSGTYSLGFDLSEMMKMGVDTENSSNTEQIDSLIVFSDFIEMKKDSIATLSKQEQKKIKELEAFSIYIKSDTITNNLKMKINYQFKDLKDLALFGEKLNKQNIKELEILNSNTKSTNESKNNEMFNLNDAFITHFNENKFTLKISPEALKKSEKEKDTTLTADNPMAGLIRFKLKYTFPYRIKKVTNENAKVLADFKGIEIYANLYELNNNPKYFNTEVEFENN